MKKLSKVKSKIATLLRENGSREVERDFPQLMTNDKGYQSISIRNMWVCNFILTLSS